VLKVGKKRQQNICWRSWKKQEIKKDKKGVQKMEVLIDRMHCKVCDLEKLVAESEIEKHKG